jgi:hypothetical protein
MVFLGGDIPDVEDPDVENRLLVESSPEVGFRVSVTPADSGFGLSNT